MFLFLESSLILPLFALGMTFSMLLWGALLGSIPVLIHLLHKRKYRETDWAAMRFLLAAARKHSRRVRLEQLLLLVVRTLILLFLVGALQGFYFESTTAGSNKQHGPVHHLIVIDASFSMRYRPDEQVSRYEAARKIALQIVDDARPGDLFNLVLITGTSKRVLISTPAKSQTAVRQAIAKTVLPSSSATGKTTSKTADKTVKEDVFKTTTATAAKLPAVSLRRASSRLPQTATQEAGQLLPTLTAVEQLLAKTKTTHKTVYFISDFQKKSWLPGSEPRRQRYNQSLRRIAELASLRLLTVGHKTVSNTAVTKLESLTPFAMTGRPIELTATIQNFGAEIQHDQTVSLYIDGRLRDSQQLTLQADEKQSVRFTFPPANATVPLLTAGEHYFEVRLQEDDLPLDNVRGLSLPVKDELSVLLVDGHPGSSRRENPTFFLQKGFPNKASGAGPQDFIQMKTITDAEFLGTDLSKIDCVFLCNVPLFRENEARQLQTYVENGGGLIICLGNQVRAQNYNHLLYRDGDGLLPVKIGQRMERRYQSRNPYRLNTAQLAHPLLNRFHGNPKSGLNNVFSYRYFQTERSLIDQSRVVLRFKKTADDELNDPVLLESRIGLGRVLLLTTSFNPRWSTWAATHSFLPLVDAMIHFAVAGRWNRRQYQVGDPLEKGFPTRLSNRLPKSIPINFPDGTTRSISIRQQNRWRIRRGGANYFATAPTKTTALKKDGTKKTTHSLFPFGKSSFDKPAGKIPSYQTVQKRQHGRSFSQIEWQGRSGWVHNSRLKRNDNAGLFFSGAMQQGRYELLFPPLLGGREQYAVNLNTEESDLASLNENGLQTGIFSGVTFYYHKKWQHFRSESHEVTVQQNLMTRWLLIAVFGLILVEQLMAWKFLPGFFLLLLLIFSEFSRQAFRWNLASGIIVGLLLTGLFTTAIILIRKRQRSEISRSQRWKNV